MELAGTGLDFYPTGRLVVFSNSVLFQTGTPLFKQIPETESGLELLVRYPAEIRRAPDIDEKMTRKVLDLVETDTELKVAVSGNPKIRSAIEG